MKRKIILAGGSGFIGGALAKIFSANGFEVLILTRSPKARADGIREIEWNGKDAGDWLQALDGADAVINLTGKNINCPHTPENVRELTASRVNSIHALAAALSQVTAPPRVWVQAGAVGFYGDSKKVCDENSPSGNTALAQICQQWEGAFQSTAAPRTRKILLRIGFVLGREGGALPVLKRLAKLFVGGAAGDGEQFISWIHLDDLTRMFLTAVNDEKLSGIFNAVSPAPETNASFMRELRHALHRPWSPPAPEFTVRLGSRLLHSEPTLILESQRCVPEHFLQTGFQFQFAELRDALENLCR